MRHQKHKYKLGVTPSHRKSLIRNLAISLIEHGSIKTTLTKAKAVQPFIEKIITRSKEDSVANRRLVASRLNSSRHLNSLFNEYGKRFKDRNGGYTRITKLADRRLGDSSKMAVISLLNDN